MKLLADKPTISDRFGLSARVEECVQLLGTLDRGSTPFTILLEGVPGIGKSSFLAMLDRQLQQGQAVTSAVVSLRRLECHERLLAGLVHTLTRSLSLKIDKDILQDLQNTTLKIDETLRKGSAPTPSHPLGTFHQPAHAFRVEQLLRDYLRKIHDTDNILLIAFDQADNCDPKLLSLLFSLLETYFAVPGVVTILAGEEQRMRQRIGTATENALSSSYQLKLRLPILSPSQIHTYLDDQVPPTYQATVDSLVNLMEPTPRFVKKFVNQLQLLTDDTAGSVQAEPRMIALLALISMRFPDLYLDLEHYGKRILAALSGIVGARESGGPMDAFLAKLPKIIRDRVRIHIEHGEVMYLLQDHLNFMLRHDLNPYLFPRVVMNNGGLTGHELDTEASSQSISLVDSQFGEDILPDDLPSKDDLDDLDDDFEEDLDDDEMPEYEEDEESLDPPHMATLPGHMKDSGVPNLGNPVGSRRTMAKQAQSSAKKSQLSSGRLPSRQVPPGIDSPALSKATQSSNRVSPSPVSEEAQAPAGEEELASSSLSREEVIAKANNGESLANADLTDVDLRDTDLKGIDLSGAILTRANFERTNLRKANLEGAIIEEAVFSGANLMDANLKDAQGSSTDFFGANLWGAALDQADLPGANLRGANMRAATLNDANFETANMMSTELVDAILNGSNFVGVVFDQDTTLHFASVPNWKVDAQVRDFVEKKYSLNEKKTLVPRTKSR